MTASDTKLVIITDTGPADDTGSNRSRQAMEVTVENIQNPPPRSERSSTRSSPPPTPTPPSPSPTPKSFKLATVSDELVLESENLIKISGRILIKNLTFPSTSIVYKIKTTNPAKFHVWPTIGLIADRGSAVSKVTVKPGIEIPSVRHDKFQVEVMVVPKNLLSTLQAIEEDDQYGNSDASSGHRDRRSSLAGEPGHSVSTLSELNASWKKIAETGTQLEAHRVIIRVDSNLLQEAPEPPSSSNSSTANTQEEEKNTEQNQHCSQNIERMVSRLDSLDENISEQLSYLQWLIYTLMGAVVMFTFVNFGMAGLGNFLSQDGSLNVNKAFSLITQQVGGFSSSLSPPPAPPEQVVQPAIAAVYVSTPQATPKQIPQHDLCPLFG